MWYRLEMDYFVGSLCCCLVLAWGCIQPFRERDMTCRDDEGDETIKTMKDRDANELVVYFLRKQDGLLPTCYAPCGGIGVVDYGRCGYKMP